MLFMYAGTRQPVLPSRKDFRHLGALSNTSNITIWKIDLERLLKEQEQEDQKVCAIYY